MPELKLLIDAVESSKFITEKKRRELAKELISLTSEKNAEKLRRNMLITGRILGPENVREQYREMLQRAIDGMKTERIEDRAIVLKMIYRRWEYQA